MRTIVAAAIIFLTVSLAPAQKLDREPYPQNMTPHSVEILWRTDVATETWAELREADGGAPVTYHSNVPTSSHQILLPLLKPDTQYFYRVGYGNEKNLIEEPLMFRTFPEADLTSYSFVAFGDHRNFPNDHRAVVDAIIRRSELQGWPRFALDTGDFTGNGEHKTDFWNEQFFKPERGLISRVCFFPVIGNHECGYRHPRIPFRYLKNFSVPTDRSGTEYYYSFDFADSHFCMIDAYATEFTTETKQYEWIRQDLKKCDKRWRFAALHFPPFVDRKAPTVSYGNLPIREALVPLFERYGVTAVFCGDSHFYQRSEVNGVHYICTGGGGAPLYDPGDKAEYVRASKKAHHYSWVTIEGDQMMLRVFDTRNELIDSMTASPRQPIVPPKPVLNYVKRLPDSGWTTGPVTIIESRLGDGSITSGPVYQEEGVMSDSSSKSKAEGLKGKGSRFSDNMKPDAKVTFAPGITERGIYLVSVTVPATSGGDAPNTLFEVRSPGNDPVRGQVPLTTMAAGDGWLDIGLFELAPGAAVTFIEADEEPNRFVSDAVRFVRMTANRQAP